jgi:rhamnosyltransferase subunit B
MAFVIATAWGVRGDVMPYIDVGAELRNRGHDVTLVANPFFEEPARTAALSFVPVGTVEQYHALVGDRGLWDRSTYMNAGVKHMLPTVEGFYQAVVKAHRPGGTTLLASRPGTWIAKERLEIPAVSLLFSPSLLSRVDPMHPSRPLPAWANLVGRSRRGLRLIHGLKALRDAILVWLGRPVLPGYAAELLAEIHRVRSLAGLPERPASVEAVRPALAIALWPSWFSPAQKDWPAGLRVVGFPLGPRPEARSAAPESAQGSRPIVFTRGSGASHQKAFFAEAVRCSLLLGSPGVLVTPHAADVPSDLPGTVSHLPFARIGELFGRSAAVVHHGGVGTMARALAAGIPQVVVPIVGDQFDLGYRMERLGVGTMLTQTPVTGVRLAREVQRLCRSETVRRRCESLRHRLEAEDGCSLAADWIEELIVSRQSRAAGRAYDCTFKHSARIDRAASRISS